MSIVKLLCNTWKQFIGYNLSLSNNEYLLREFQNKIIEVILKMLTANIYLLCHMGAF